MNRREFFRRTLPAVAVTVACVATQQPTGFFRSLIRRVLSWIEEEHRTSEIERQLRYQAKMAIRALSRQIGDYFYSAPSGALA